MTCDSLPGQPSPGSRATRRRNQAIAVLALFALAGIISLLGRGPGISATSWWLDAPDELRGEGSHARKPCPDGVTPQPGGAIRLALLTDVDSFNPFVSHPNAETRGVFDLVFPRLTYEEPDFAAGPPTFRPGLAASWTIAPDARSIRLRLRAATWSDGTAITAEDVRFSWQAAASPEVLWRNRSIVAGIDDVEVDGERELTIRFATASRYNLMDASDFHVIPRHRFARVPFSAWPTHGNWFEEARVAGGPFRLETYRQNQEITLARNPHFWRDGLPRIDRVHCRVFGNTDAMFSAFLADEVDVVRKVPFELTRRVRASREHSLFSFESLSMGLIVWNTGRAPLDDPRVRRALAIAIPRENIVRTEFGDAARVARSTVHSSLWAHDRELRPQPEDPEASTRLLAGAGFAPGPRGTLERDGLPFVFELLVGSGNKVRRQVCEHIRRRLEAIGVRVEVELCDANELGRRLGDAHDFDAALVGINSPTKVDLAPLFHSRSIGAGRNYASFRNERLDRVLDLVRNAVDQESAKQLWDEAQEILDAEQPVTPLWEERGYAAFHKRVQDVRVTALSAYDNSEEWWIAR